MPAMGARPGNRMASLLKRAAHTAKDLHALEKVFNPMGRPVAMRVHGTRLFAVDPERNAACQHKAQRFPRVGWCNARLRRLQAVATAPTKHSLPHHQT